MGGGGGRGTQNISYARVLTQVLTLHALECLHTVCKCQVDAFHLFHRTQIKSQKYSDVSAFALTSSCFSFYLI